jgi:hypothetical protein
MSAGRRHYIGSISLGREGRTLRSTIVNAAAMIAQFAERVPMTKCRWDPEADTATSYAWFVWSLQVGRKRPGLYESRRVAGQIHEAGPCGSIWREARNDTKSERSIVESDVRAGRRSRGCF